MMKFEKIVEKFRSAGFNVKFEYTGYCREATATKLVKVQSKDPWGNETSHEVFYREICYTITEYDKDDIYVVREY